MLDGVLKMRITETKQVDMIVYNIICGLYESVDDTKENEFFDSTFDCLNDLDQAQLERKCREYLNELEN